jgi:hypothetical protein
MSKRALFEGLVIDENDRSVGTAVIGDEAFYVVDDMGFKRHIPAEQVDREVMRFFTEQVKGNENFLSEQTAKMMGQDDIFTRAIIENQLKNMDQQIDAMLTTGLPEEARMYLGMTGFKIVINFHGEVIHIEQPAASDGGESDGDE